MNERTVALGLGAPMPEPASVWPATSVIELLPDLAKRLGHHPEEAVRDAIAAQAAVDVSRIGHIDVTMSRGGSALVRLAAESDAMRALHVAARRRATNVAEALHAAVLALD